MRRELSPYIDGRLPEGQRLRLRAHVRECQACSLRLEQLRQVRGTVRVLPKMVPPAELQVALKVIASRERARKTDPVMSPWARFLVHLNNSMRPLALPFAGGLVSAVMLFSIIAPAYPVINRMTTPDVATVLYTEASLKSVAPFEFTGEDIIVDVTIDETGRVVDFELPQSPGQSPAMRQAIANSLLFAQFAPATTFGQPTTGRLRLSFRRSHIDVRG